MIVGDRINRNLHLSKFPKESQQFISFQRELETKSTRLDEVENELSRERKTLEDLKSQADQKKLDSVRTSERIADLERQVEAKMGELEAVNREKSEHEAVISVLENQFTSLETALNEVKNNQKLDWNDLDDLRVEKLDLEERKKEKKKERK